MNLTDYIRQSADTEETDELIETEPAFFFQLPEEGGSDV